MFTFNVCLSKVVVACFKDVLKSFVMGLVKGKAWKKVF